MRRLLVFVFSGFLFAACQPASSSQENQGQPDSNQSTVLNSDEQTEAAPLDLDKPQAKANAQASVAFGKPSALEMPALTQLCQNPYGCLQERLFPLGWSADNKFAFLLERTNEAVSNYTLDAYILDARTNTVLDSLSFVAREQADYSEAADQFDFNIVWGLQEKALRKLVAEHRIDFGSGIKLSALAALDLTINAEDKRKTSMYTGKEVLSKHTLSLQAGEASRNLYVHTYGKYELVLATELLGAFHQPGGTHYALLEAEEHRGFEGPPNVLKLRVIGF